ncbi:integral membrane transport protein [Microbacterium mangrovi]|uniref:Integral membrane transport protein n=1 Tax=Microbacterium mangrovi TaxID=1348253 RepID=A0A0B1ZWM7_9MICO|nr:ABC transporter permease subunit [Microbacterium mangrovi]KHK95149.1 integral membrane transport protein [Microbacterium mangrovi]
MTTLTHTPAPVPAVRTRSPYRLTFGGQLRSEAVKIATVRSTWWSVGITVALTIGIAVLLALTVGGQMDRPIMVAVAPIQFTMLLAGILGAITVTGEYSTGMVRSTLTADPIRGSVLTAKAIVGAVLMFVTAFVTFTVAALATAPILARHDTSVDWASGPDTWLPLLSASFSMAVFALLGVGLGFVIRSGAGAIAAVVGILFVLPVVTSMFPAQGSWAWVSELGHYLPMSASQNLILPSDLAPLSAGGALLTLTAWALVPLLAGWALLRTRDA